MKNLKNKPVKKLCEEHPELKAFWDAKQNEDVFRLEFEDVLENSRDRLFWKCPECNYTMRVQPTAIVRYGLRCERCKQQEAIEKRKENDEKKRLAREAKAKREATKADIGKTTTAEEAASGEQAARTPRGCDANGATAVVGRQVKTGKTVRFDNAREAAQAVGLRWPSDITKVCRGNAGHRSAGGYEWRWLSEAPEEWLADIAPACDKAIASEVSKVGEKAEKAAADENTLVDSVAADTADDDENLGEAHLRYATSFAVESATGKGSVWPLIIESVYDWFDYKDKSAARHVAKRRLADVVDYDIACAWRPDMAISPAAAARLRRELAVALAPFASKKYIEEKAQASLPIVSVPPYVDLREDEANAPRSAVVPEAFARGFEARRGILRVATASARDDEGQLREWAAWLMESRPEKHDAWLTEINVTPRADGSAFVKVRNGVRYDNGASEREHVQSTQPKCVLNIISRNDLICRRGGVRLTTTPHAVDLTSTQEFEAFLLEIADTSRRIPLIVVNSNEAGKYPLSDASIARLSERLCGVAQVCTILWTDAGLSNRFRKGLAELTSQYSLAPQSGEINVYLGVHAGADGEGVAKQLVVQDKNESRTIQRILNTIIDKTKERIDVEALPAPLQPSNDDRADDRKKDEATVQDGEESSSSDAVASQCKADGDNAIESLQQAAEDAQKSLERLHKAIARLQTAPLPCSKDDSAGRDAARSEREAIAKAQYYERLYNETKSERDALEAKLAAMDDLEAIPTNMSEVVALAGRMFADRLVITPKAVRSAEDDSTGGYTEAWRILRALYRDLWPMCFDRDDKPGDRLSADFKLRTGFELSMNENAITKSSQRCRTQRTLTYGGKTLSLEPHVKGTSGNKSNRLRVYFAIDREERKIVVGHCGNHLETIGTKRREL